VSLLVVQVQLQHPQACPSSPFLLLQLGYFPKYHIGGNYHNQEKVHSSYTILNTPIRNTYGLIQISFGQLERLLIYVNVSGLDFPLY